MSGRDDSRRSRFYSGSDGTRLMTFATRVFLPSREARRTLFDERQRALDEVLAARHLALDLRLKLELLGHPRVQPAVELALGAGVGERRAGGQARGERAHLLGEALVV